ncbi:hypothetical protein JCM12298_25700 [Desulfothermus naphthae]
MTKEFKSLKASGLSEDFDAEVDGSEPIIDVSEEEDHITISCILPGFDLSDNEQDVKGEKMPFKEVGISGVGFVSESGKPLMPVFRRFVNVPQGCDIEVNVKKGNEVTFDDILVTPAQEKAMDGEEEHEFEFDEEAYKKDEFYPKNIVKVSDPQDVDGYNAVLVEICPLQFNPVKRKIRGYGNITITLKFSPKDEEDEENRFPFIDPELEREGFGNLFLNPRRRTVTMRPSRPILPPPPLFSPEFIIIYHPSFSNAAQKLANWKNTKGISTQIVDIGRVGNTVADIKKFIRTRRKPWFSRLRYVLLFGDTNHIVTENVSGNATDYYYSTPRDPSSGSDCVSPWIAIGRIPVQTKQEAQDVVDQIISYEKNPPCDPAYYERMTVAAYFQDDWPQDGKADRAYMKTMEGIRSHLVSIGKEVQRVYVTNNPNPQKYKDGTTVPAEVKSAIVDETTATGMLISETAEGQLIVGHRDHGGTTGWAHPPFTISNLDAIMSTYPSIFLSINCWTGRFDLSAPSDCFAEAMLKLKGGAPSLIAATRPSGTWRNDSLIKALFDALFPGVIPTYPDTTASYAIKNNRLGDILNYAKMYLFVAHGINSGVKDHLEIYHVIGDPTLEVWKELPRVINLTAKVIRRYLLIQLSHSPKGGVITISERGKILKTVKTSSTQVKVPLKNLKLLKPIPGIRRRIISVCLSAPGYRFIEKKVMI